MQEGTFRPAKLGVTGGWAPASPKKLSDQADTGCPGTGTQLLPRGLRGEKGGSGWGDRSEVTFSHLSPGWLLITLRTEAWMMSPLLPAWGMGKPLVPCTCFAAIPLAPAPQGAQGGPGLLAPGPRPRLPASLGRWGLLRPQAQTFRLLLSSTG